MYDIIRQSNKNPKVTALYGFLLPQCVDEKIASIWVDYFIKKDRYDLLPKEDERSSPEQIINYLIKNYFVEPSILPETTLKLIKFELDTLEQEVELDRLMQQIPYPDYPRCIVKRLVTGDQYEIRDLFHKRREIKNRLQQIYERKKTNLTIDDSVSPEGPSSSQGYLQPCPAY